MDLTDTQWQLVVEELRKLKDEDIPSGYGSFYKTYRSYDAMTFTQKSRTKDYFARLPIPVKEKIVKLVEDKRSTGSVETIPRLVLKETSVRDTGVSIKEPSTTKNDKSR